MFTFTNDHPDFYIQLKGENSGRPIKHKIPNSIGVKAWDRILDPRFFYYLVDYLYMTDSFKQHLKGSVVPYIRQRDILLVVIQHFKSKG